MTSPPSGWLDGLLRVALTLLALALMLNLAARLVVAVLPVLLAAAGVVVLVFIGWSIYRFRQSRW